MSEVSEAFVLAVEAVGNAIGIKPLPQGLNTATVGDWKLTLNASKERHGDIGPYEVLAENEKFFAVGIFGPDGGMIGGCSEDQFIAELKATTVIAIKEGGES